MKFQVNANDLKQAMAKIKKAVTKASSSGVMKYTKSVKVVVGEEGVTLLTTDLDTTVEVTVEAYIEETGECVLLVDKINKVLSKLKHSGDVEVEKVGDDLAVKFGTKSLTFNGYPLDQFPDTSFAVSNDSTTVNAKYQLVPVLKTTLGYASKDFGRPNLTCVYVENKNDVTSFVATDGHRLSWCQRDFKMGGADDTSYLIERRCVEVIIGLFKDGDVKIVHEERGISNYVSFECDDVKIGHKVPDYKFPDFRQVLTPATDVFVVPSEEVIASIDVAANFTGKMDQVVLKFEECELKITNSPLSQAEEGKYEDAIESFVESSITGVTKPFGVNFKYLKQALEEASAGGRRVRFGYSDAMSPLHIAAPDSDDLFIVMPMRI